MDKHLRLISFILLAGLILSLVWPDETRAQVGMAYYKLDRDDQACPPSTTGMFAF